MSDPVDLGFDRVARSRAGQRVRAEQPGHWGQSPGVAPNLALRLTPILQPSGASEPADPNLKLVLV